MQKKISAVIEVVRELVISSMHKKLEQDTRNTCHVIVPTSKC